MEGDVMDKLENKILNNVPYFTDNNPNDGHKARFAAKLNQSLPVKSKKAKLHLYMQIAAAIIVLVSVSYLVLNDSSNNNNNNNRDEMYITQIEYSNELYQVQNYYDELSLARLAKIDELADSDEEAQKLKSKAIKKMDKLDANLAKIEKEYVKNPQCDKLKAAIVNNKKMKVKVVDNIVEQLDNAQQGYHAGSMYTNF